MPKNHQPHPWLVIFYCRDRDSNPSKCGADERRRRGLDRAAHWLNRIPHPLPIDSLWNFIFSPLLMSSQKRIFVFLIILQPEWRSAFVLYPVSYGASVADVSQRGLRRWFAPCCSWWEAPLRKLCFPGWNLTIILHTLSFGFYMKWIWWNHKVPKNPKKTRRFYLWKS